jgi:hypothetical protein
MSLQTPDISQLSPKDIGLADQKIEIKKKSFWDKAKKPVAELLAVFGIVGGTGVAIHEAMNQNEMAIPKYQVSASEKNNFNQAIEEIIGNKEIKVTIPAKSGEKIAPEAIFSLDSTKEASIIKGKFDIGVQDSEGWHSLDNIDYSSVADRPQVAYGIITGQNEKLSYKNIGEHDLEVFYDDDHENYFPSITDMRSDIYTSEDLHKNLVIHHINLKDNVIVMESWEKTQMGDEVKPNFPSLYLGNFRVTHYPNTKEVEYTVTDENQPLVYFPDINYMSNIKADGPGFLIQVNTIGSESDKDITKDFIVNKLAPSIPNSTLISK